MKNSLSGKLISMALAGAMLAGCGSTTSTGATGVGRKQVLLMGEETVNQQSAAAYQQMLAAAQQKGVLNRNPAQLARLRQIAGRIIPQTRAFRADAPNWNWQVNLIQANTANAFVAPGGKIMFFSGIIDRPQLTDDEIAAIMAHEIAHALRQHSREQASVGLLQQVGLAVLGSQMGLSQSQMQVAGALTSLGVDRPFSRSHETEADVLGLELMARAGYNPQGALTLWRKMSQLAGRSEPPQFLSTHPATANRVATIQARLPQVMPLYQQARQGSFR